MVIKPCKGWEPMLALTPKLTLFILSILFVIPELLQERCPDLPVGLPPSALGTPFCSWVALTRQSAGYRDRSLSTILRGRSFLKGGRVWGLGGVTTRPWWWPVPPWAAAITEKAEQNFLIKGTTKKRAGIYSMSVTRQLTFRYMDTWIEIQQMTMGGMLNPW